MKKTTQEWREEAQNWIDEIKNEYFFKEDPTKEQIFNACKKELADADVDGVDNDYKSKLLDYIADEILN